MSDIGERVIHQLMLAGFDRRKENSVPDGCGCQPRKVIRAVKLLLASSEQCDQQELTSRFCRFGNISGIELGVMMTANVGPQVMARETTSLIASDKVEGTAIRRSNGDKVGTIERVMIDKRSGKVAYAVMTFGGFSGHRRRISRAAMELVALQ
jgi:PRC-barrel domain protein